MKLSDASCRALFENSIDAIFKTLCSGEIIAANRAACELFGMTEEELCRAGCHGLVDSADPRPPSALLELTAGGKCRCQLTFVAKDGTKFPGEVTSVLLDEAGTAFVILRDITEHRRAEEALQRYTQHLLVLDEDLRRRIASELHDDVGQLLSALAINLSFICNGFPKVSRTELQSRLGVLKELTRELSRAVRDLMTDLIPWQLDKSGLPEAISSYVNQYAQRTGTDMDVHVDSEFPRLSVPKEIALFRITQEALTNVVKHAGATKATVSLNRLGDSVLLSIEDDGQGGVPKADLPLPSGSGWGLTIMRERAERVGGRFRLHSALGKGTSISIEMSV